MIGRLKQKKERLELFEKSFESSPNSRVLAEYRDGRPVIIKVNKAFTEYYGYKPKEVIGKEPKTLNSGTYGKEHYEKMWKHILNPKKGFWRDEIINKKKNGKLINVILTIHTLFDKKGNATHFVADHVDITKQKKIIAKANRLAKKLQKSNKLKEMFVDILRHDILNPVGVVKMYSEMITGKDKREQKYIRAIKRASNKAENIANKAQQYAKVEDAKSIDKKRLYLKDVIAQVCKDVRSSYRREGIKLVNKVKARMPIMANPLISEVFLNFLTNALKYGKKGKLVEVEAEDSDGFYKIKIIDYGEGIEKKFQKGIFTRLERAGAREGVVGTGLGLAIAKKTAQLHGGEVWVEDNPKGGAVFVTKLSKK